MKKNAAFIEQIEGFLFYNLFRHKYILYLGIVSK